MKTRLALGLLVAGCATSPPAPAPEPPGGQVFASPIVSPARVAVAPAAKQAPPLQRDLDGFVEVLEAAAKADDRETILAIWKRDSTSTSTNRSGPLLSHEDMQWLAAMMRSDCGFLNDRDHWVCPRSAVEGAREPPTEEDVWIEFRRKPSSGWRWTTVVFPSDPAAVMPAPVVEPILPSSASVVEGKYGPGELDKHVIRTVVRRHIPEVRDCYNVGLATDPALAGRVAIQFSIGPDGAVARAEVAQTTLGDTAVPRCIAAAVLRWVFPRPLGGGNVVVTYPFVLEPG